MVLQCNMVPSCTCYCIQWVKGVDGIFLTFPAAGPRYRSGGMTEGEADAGRRGYSWAGDLDGGDCW